MPEQQTLGQLALDIAAERGPSPAEQLAALEAESAALPGELRRALAAGDFAAVDRLEAWRAELPALVRRARLRALAAERDTITGELEARRVALTAELEAAREDVREAAREVRRIREAADAEARPHEARRAEADGRCTLARAELEQLASHEQFIRQTRLNPLNEQLRALTEETVSGPTPQPAGPSSRTAPPGDLLGAQLQRAADVATRTARYDNDGPDDGPAFHTSIGFGPGHRPDLAFENGPTRGTGPAPERPKGPEGGRTGDAP